ncbi:tyrosine-protein phosphatase [Bombilactobacillus folatiphilus]|uniref:Tyrosine-protein phosphatase n=1 Tax=Bombilactobacillus folatiphilus TaxID=2923362 RepID=A0ABY4PA02_9LACO|nr:tyrosine-protein phosphatase [Bombilactobacillus folatiphilus]UQS82534.1 tyrosine-protein phosphatase [Bombilactobacillus folatiphilus]
MIDNKPVNFRDIGGINVANGTLKAGIFLRSGQLVDLNDATVDFLTDTCQLQTIYDFRSTKETTEMPDTTVPNTQWKHLDILADATANYASMNKMVENSGNAHQHMLETYEQLIVSSSAQTGYQTFMNDLIQEPKTILFHCFAGKDRTGFAAALILKVAGASDETIMDDYLLTNKLRQQANQEMLETYRDQITEQQAKEMMVALQVAPEYLLRAKETIQQEFGTFDNYLHQGLHLVNDYTEQFRKLYVK